MESEAGYIERRVLHHVNRLRARFNLARLRALPAGCRESCVSPDCRLLAALEAVPDVHLARNELVAENLKAAEIVLLAWYGSTGLLTWGVESGPSPDLSEYPIDLPDEMLAYLNSVYPSWGRE